MAKLVLAAGVPHPPRLVFEMQQAPGKIRGELLMKQVREQVDKAEPDVIIEVDSDISSIFSTTLYPRSASEWRKKRRDRRKIGVRCHAIPCAVMSLSPRRCIGMACTTNLISPQRTS